MLVTIMQSFSFIPHPASEELIFSSPEPLGSLVSLR